MARLADPSSSGASNGIKMRKPQRERLRGMEWSHCLECLPNYSGAKMSESCVHVLSSGDHSLSNRQAECQGRKQSWMRMVGNTGISSKLLSPPQPLLPPNLKRTVCVLRIYWEGQGMCAPYPSSYERHSFYLPFRTSCRFPFPLLGWVASCTLQSDLVLVELRLEKLMWKWARERKELRFNVPQSSLPPWPAVRCYRVQCFRQLMII